MRFIGVILILGGIGGIFSGDILFGLFILCCGIFVFRSNSKKGISKKESINEKENVTKAENIDKEERVIQSKSEPARQKQLTFRVVGVTKEGRQSLIKEIVNDWKELYPYEIYEGLSNKEILKYGDDVYEVDIFGYDEISLVPEPDNPYDPNAIKVMHKDVGMIGYVPKHQTSTVRRFLDNDCKLEWAIVGGKLKYVDWDEDKVRTKTLTYGVEISLSVKSNNKIHR